MATLAGDSVPVLGLGGAVKRTARRPLPTREDLPPRVLLGRRDEEVVCLPCHLRAFEALPTALSHLLGIQNRIPCVFRIPSKPDAIHCVPCPCYQNLIIKPD